MAKTKTVVNCSFFFLFMMITLISSWYHNHHKIYWHDETKQAPENDDNENDELDDPRLTYWHRACSSGQKQRWHLITIYPKKYAHGFCFAVLCCGYTLTDFPISIRLTSLALWQSNDCPIASKATQMNMDKYFMWIHYERLHNHNKAKHNKTVCIFLGLYCMCLNNQGPFH